MLTRQWCYALDFLRCYVNTSVMLHSWRSSLLCCYVNTSVMLHSWRSSIFFYVSDVTLLTFFVVMLTRQWCYALGFLGFMLTQWLKAILNAMTVYRKDCLAGIVKLSPSDAFKVAKLHWMSWNTRKKSSRVVRWRFATFFHWKFPEIMTKPPVLSSFSRRRGSGFARISIDVTCAYMYDHPEVDTIWIFQSYSHFSQFSWQFTVPYFIFSRIFIYIYLIQFNLHNITHN